MTSSPPESSLLTVMLAGGKGSRLHELTEPRCKPAVPFAGHRRIVDWTLGNVVKSGITRLAVATQYRPGDLVRHLDRHWRPAFDGGLSIWHGPEITGNSEGFLGTAGAVAAVIPRIDALSPTHLLVVAADHVYGMDYRRMVTAHRASGAAVTVAVDTVPRTDASAFGVVHAREDGAIAGFVEKPADPPAMPGRPDSALVSMGIYVFDWIWLRAALLDDTVAPASHHDFGHDILPLAVSQGSAQVFHAGGDDGLRTRSYWRDVGTLDAYRAAWLDFAGGRVPCAVPDYPSGAHLLHRDGDRDDDGSNAILPGARVAPGADLTCCIVAPGAQVPSELNAGHDLSEDRRWFRVTPGGTTLITAEMLARRAAARPPSVQPRHRFLSPLMHERRR